MPSIAAKHLSPIAIAVGLTLSACESPGGDVSVLRSDTVSVRPGSTFAWAPGATPGQGDPRVDNDIVQGRIQNAVVSALTAKGYQQGEPASADLLVSFHVGLQNRTETRVNSFGPPPVACGMRGCMGGYGWGMYGPPTNLDVQNLNYVEGTMMLDLTDRLSGKLAWRATSQRRVDQGDSDQAVLNAIVADMVRTLP